MKENMKSHHMTPLKAQNINRKKHISSSKILFDEPHFKALKNIWYPHTCEYYNRTQSIQRTFLIMVFIGLEVNKRDFCDCLW